MDSKTRKQVTILGLSAEVCRSYPKVPHPKMFY